GVVRVLDPHRYRCSFCKQLSACTLDCLNHIEEVIQYEGPHTIAAVLVESVVGTNGVIIPPDGYMQGLRELCSRHDILLICDEVGLNENARRMGRVLGSALEDLKDRHPSIGDVRYIGLFAAIELVKDRATREPLVPFNAAPSQLGAMTKLGAYFRENGLFTFL